VSVSAFWLSVIANAHLMSAFCGVAYWFRSNVANGMAAALH
jgi:hypothetical protein